MAQSKLRVYEVLVKHYSHTDRPALLPNYMSDVYTAIIDLLGEIWRDSSHNDFLLSIVGQA